MEKLKIILTSFVFAIFIFTGQAQNTSDSNKNDSVQIDLENDFSTVFHNIEKQRIADSIEIAELRFKISTLNESDKIQVLELQKKLTEAEERDNKIKEEKKKQIDFLKRATSGYPVTGVLDDTLFNIFTKRGELSASERAATLSRKIEELYNDDFFNIDSLVVTQVDNTSNIMYGNVIVLSLSETDALWYDKSTLELGNEFRDKIANSILKAKEEYSLSKILIRSGFVILIFALTWILLWMIRLGNNKMLNAISKNKERWLKKLAYKDYTFLDEDQEYNVILFLAKLLRWFIYIILIYISMSVAFSVFPFTQGWADKLIQLILSPLKSIFTGIWNYLPNLFSILAIYLVMKYFIRLVRYVFSEIEAEKLRISGFHADWAMPTFSIIRFLLYAFMFVLIFQFLPYSDSNIFKGVSVFIGVLFSLGSTSAISNLVAGLVITYMRPFKIGDRIKIGEVTGDVIEKSLLVTRLKTPKNEEITIPNGTVLSGNTINYSSMARTEGLIIHTTVTIGYDVPWKNIHQALLNAADRTDSLLKEPKPFVLQTSLDDFYVAYQINGYTRITNRHNIIYSNLHQNIQDCCNEAGIEILSPHYRFQRDGNSTTIPADYLPKDYKAPGFKINVEKDDSK